jgi:hypothetical protein
MGTEIRGLEKGCLSLGGDQELAWRSMTWSSGMQVEAIAHDEFIV